MTKDDVMGKELKAIRKRERQCAKTLKGRALMVIDCLVCNDGFNEDKLLSQIYRVAHSATGVCGNKHEDWVAETEKLYKEDKDVQN